MISYGISNEGGFMKPHELVADEQNWSIYFDEANMLSYVYSKIDEKIISTLHYKTFNEYNSHKMDLLRRHRNNPRKPKGGVRFI